MPLHIEPTSIYVRKRYDPVSVYGLDTYLSWDHKLRHICLANLLQIVDNNGNLANGTDHTFCQLLKITTKPVKLDDLPNIPNFFPSQSVGCTGMGESKSNPAYFGRLSLAENRLEDRLRPPPPLHYWPWAQFSAVCCICVGNCTVLCRLVFYLYSNLQCLRRHVVHSWILFCDFSGRKIENSLNKVIWLLLSMHFVISLL